MNKVKFLDHRLLNLFGKVVAGISTVLSILLIFVSIPEKWKISTGIIFTIILLVLYIILWKYVSRLRNVRFELSETKIEIKFGNLFEENGLKIIPFNEYFDTQVDNKVISSKSLNGQFIENFFSSSDSLGKLNEKIENDQFLQKKIVGDNRSRSTGKKIKYKIGSLLELNNGFIITAMTHFDDNNKANLSMAEYISFLMEFWENISYSYNQRTVVIPVMGSGITKFREGYGNAKLQDLLQIILWTFEVSKIKLELPSKLIVVISEEKEEKVNLFKLKGMSKDGL
ncbi:TPA: macro domain-containing protein [Streptococcus suis]